MRLILNVIWLIFGGLWLALGYLLAAPHLLHPHHHDPVRLRRVPHRRLCAVAVRPHHRRQARTRPGALIGNVIWVILFGIWLAIGHVVTAVAMAITIIGIPLALANLKLIPVSLVPLGKEIVPIDQPRAVPSVAGRRMTVTALGLPSVQRPVSGMRRRAVR